MESTRPRWAWTGVAGGAVLGLVFLVAAFPKALDPVGFAEQIRLEGLDFALPANFLAWAVVVLEAGLGAALVVGLRRRWVLVPAGFLVVFFVFLTARTYMRFLNGTLDEAASCGCFGNLVDRSPAEAFWQDLLLLVPPFLLAAFVGRRYGVEGKRWRLVLVAFIAVGAAGLTWASPTLPLDDLATRLGVGKRVDSFCAGGGGAESHEACLDLLVPQLLEGRHLVVIEDLDAEAIEATVDALNRIVSESPDAAVWLLTDDPGERIQAFFWEWGPRFEVREVPLPLIRPLYRTLPRAFFVVDGRVERTWSGLPEAPVANR